MTVGFGADGTAVNGTTTAAATLPAGITAGQLILVAAAWGNAENAAPSTDPAGFVRIGSAVGGTGTWGSGTGQRGVTYWYKVADGTESSATVTVNNDSATDTGKTIRVMPTRWTKTTATWATPRLTSGADTTANTAWSVTGAANPGGSTGSMLVLTNALASTTAITMTTPTMNWTGTTGTLTNMSLGTAAGNGVRFMQFRRDTTAGPATGAPTFTATLSAASAGVGAYLVLDDLLPTRTRRMSRFR